MRLAPGSLEQLLSGAARVALGIASHALAGAAKSKSVEVTNFQSTQNYQRFDLPAAQRRTLGCVLRHPTVGGGRS